MTNPDDTATIERDLEAVDTALASGSAGHGDPIARELQELALALRSDAPVPEPEFADALSRRVDAGFLRERSQRSRWGRLAGVNLWPVAGVVAPLLLIAVVVFAGGNGADDSSDGGGDAATPLTQATPESTDAGGGAAAADRAAGVPAPSGESFVPARRDRRIERSIAMTLSAPDEEIPAVADDVNRITARHGGFVLRSELDTGEDGAGGSFELRIPAGRLQAAVRDLAGSATVSSQSQSGQDVTREFVTAQDRLEAARAERRSLLRRLEEADTDAEAEAIRARLDLVAGEINGLRGQLRDLRLRTDYAIVSVDLIGDEDEDSGAGGAGSFDDAVGDAGDLLVGFAGVLIRVLAIALPLGLIALVAWLAGGALRRRRRESALA
jgi:hypothetical protein